MVNHKKKLSGALTLALLTTLYLNFSSSEIKAAAGDGAPTAAAKEFKPRVLTQKKLAQKPKAPTKTKNNEKDHKKTSAEVVDIHKHDAHSPAAAPINIERQILNAKILHALITSDRAHEHLLKGGHFLDQQRSTQQNSSKVGCFSIAYPKVRTNKELDSFKLKFKNLLATCKIEGINTTHAQSLTGIFRCKKPIGLPDSTKNKETKLFRVGYTNNNGQIEIITAYPDNDD